MTLAGLITRVEQGSGSDRQLDADICVALRYAHGISEGETIVRDGDDGKFIVNNEYNFARRFPAPNLTSSLDAIRVLMIARLEGYSLTIGSYQSGAGASVYKDSCGPTDVLNPDVHRAFLSATLKAIAAKEG